MWKLSLFLQIHVKMMVVITKKFNFLIKDFLFEAWIKEKGIQSSLEPWGEITMPS